MSTFSNNGNFLYDIDSDYFLNVQVSRSILFSTWIRCLLVLYIYIYIYIITKISLYGQNQVITTAISIDTIPLVPGRLL